MSSVRNRDLAKDARALRPNAQRVAWLVAEKALLLASSFFVGIWIVRALGPTDFGRFSIALSITAVLASVAAVGLDTLLLRRFTSDPGSARPTLVAAMAVRLAGALTHLALCWVAALLFFSEDREVALATLIVASAALLRVVDVVGLRLQAEDRYPLAASIRVMARMGGDGLRVALIMADASILWFAAAIVAEAVLSACLFALVERGVQTRRFTLDRTLARRLVLEGWPIAVSGVLAGLYARLDQAVVYATLGAQANGHYAAAVRVSELFNLLVMAVAAVAAPHFARLSGASDEEFEARLRTYFRLMVALGVGIALTVSLLAEPIMRLLYGAAFLPAAHILSIHAWTIPLVFASVAMEPWFYHYGKVSLYVLKTVIALLCAVPLVLGGAQWLGSAGVAAAVVCVYAISVIGSNALLPDARKALRFQVNAALGGVWGGAR